MASKKFVDDTLARIEGRKVNQAGLERGLKQFAVSGPGPTAYRVIKRDEEGVIQFDRTGPVPNVYSRNGVVAESLPDLLAWLDNNSFRTAQSDFPKSTFPADSPKDLRAEIEFLNAHGWVNAANGEVNLEPFDEAQ